jgi:uncharacterized delta-60 repeat protein
MAKMTSTGGNFGGALSPGSRTGGGRYLLKRLVGRGEFSELWLARDVKNVKDVALKFLPQAFLQDTNLLELLQNEIGRNRLLNHPHIVPVYELTRDHDSAAIVMEYIDGWSLATMKVDKLGKSYTVEEIEPRIRELCDALAYAHKEFGLIHGDLKPSNLLLSTREGIKISDFGFAVLIRNESSKRGIIKNGYGGIGFLSPQQVMGEPPSKLDDIYSLGATIFDLLTGTPPFYKGEVIAQICSLKPLGMTQRLGELGVQCDPLPPVWEQTVTCCLAKNSADRPQSVEEVWQMLEQNGSSFAVDAQLSEPSHMAESPNEQEAVAPLADAQTPIEAPPLLRPSPLSPANSTKIALLFVGILAAFLIVVMVGGCWFIRNAKSTPLGGTLDKSFNPGSSADNVIRCMALQTDGKILIGGLFTNFNGVVSRKIARLETNGALDVTFTPHVEGNVYAIALQADGKILIGGQGLRPKRPARRFIRLNSDGSRDAQFPGEGTYNENVRAIIVQPDGGILVGGDFTKISNKEHHGLMRLGADDKNDDSFNVSSDGLSTVTSIAVQPNGKILEAGIFNNYNNLNVTHLIRLNPDGSFDTTFDAAAYADENIKSVLLQKDGKILVCGYSNITKDVASPYIVRLNADGRADKSFHFSGRMGDAPWSIAIQADGKIIIGGCTSTDGQNRPYLARLNEDGSMDESFQIDGATGGCIWSVAVQPDGKILAVGDISSFAGQPCGNIVRLLN